MQQAATYSHMSRSSPTNSNHSNHPSTSSMPLSELTYDETRSRINDRDSSSTITPMSNLKNRESSSTIVVDSYDNGVDAMTGRKGPSDNVRRKRPSQLTFAHEQSETVVEDKTLTIKNSKDQMRKSSPTVGERFRFSPGEPPVPSIPAAEESFESITDALGGARTVIMAQSEFSRKASSASQESIHDPPKTAPPRGPLPEPPIPPKAHSRSASRSYSPPKRPIKSILRNGSRKDSPTSSSLHRRSSASPPSQFQPDMSRHGRAVISEHEVKPSLKSPAHSIERAFRATPSYTSLQSQPRKQRSTSSVRDQIIMLPESARLRKQSSGDLLRQQSSTEMLSQIVLSEAVSAMPSPNTDRYVMGNAFGRRGSNPQSATGQLSKSPSLDLRTDAARKRSVADLVHNASIQEEEAQALHTQHQTSQSRSGSDLRQPSQLRYCNVDMVLDAGHSPTADAVSTPTTIPTPKDHIPAGESIPWPLAAEPGKQPEPTPTKTRHIPRLSAGTAHSRNDSGSSRRSVSPKSTPRVSRIVPPRSTAVQRSRTNTVETIKSDVSAAAHKQPVNRIVAPSIASAQSHRSPLERLDTGIPESSIDSVSRAQTVDTKEPQSPPKISKIPKPRSGSGSKFVGVPDRTSSRARSASRPLSPPRSPLLTEGFLTNVNSEALKDDHTEPDDRDQPFSANESQPSTSMNSSIDSQYYIAHDGKKLEKDKKKKPTMKELWSAYKDSSSTYYLAQSKHAGAEHQEPEHYRPSFDHHPSGPNSPSIASARESVDRTFSMNYTSGHSAHLANKEKRRKKSGFMKSMFSSSNNWYGFAA